MKALFAALPLAAAALFAATPALAATASASQASKPAAKKPVHRKISPKKAEAIKDLEEATPTEDPDPTIKLTDLEKAIAKRVYVGDMPCELGASVNVRALHREGFFLVRIKHTRFVMHPVESKSGAIRLEDPTQGALWLQLGNKSMLMSQKEGRRLADECQSPDQKVYAEELKKHPINLLEPAPAAANASTAAPAASAPAKAGSN
jgi:hypothetical protein